MKTKNVIALISLLFSLSLISASWYNPLTWFTSSALTTTSLGITNIQSNINVVKIKSDNNVVTSQYWDGQYLNVNVTRIATGGYKWALAICPLDNMTNPRESIYSTLWTDVGELNYGKLTNWGLNSSWCPKTNNYGYVSFAGGSQNKILRYRIDNFKAFTTEVGQGTDEYIITNQTTLTYNTDDTNTNFTISCDDVPQNELFVFTYTDKIKWGANGTFEGIKSCKINITSNGLVEYDGVSYYIEEKNKKQVFNFDDICLRDLNGTQPNCNFENNSNGLIVNFNSDKYIDPSITVTSMGSSWYSTNITFGTNNSHLNSTLDSALNSYYSFDVNNYPYDDLITTRTATNTNASNTPVWTSSGFYGGAMDFSGSGQSLTPSSVFFGNSNISEWTISAWIYSEGSTGSDQKIYSEDSTSYTTTNGLGAQLGLNSTGSLVTYRYSSGSQIINSNSPPLFGAWHHVAVTVLRINPVNTNMTYRLYVDGVRLKEINGTRSVYALNTVRIGSMKDGATTDKLFFNGTIDELMLFKKQLSDSEILALYNNQTSRFYPTGKEYIPFNKIDQNGSYNSFNLTLPIQQNMGTSLNMTLWSWNNSVNGYNTNSSEQIVYYNLDGNTNDYFGVSNGSSNWGTTLTDAKLDNGYSLNGTANSRIAISSADSNSTNFMANATNFSVSAWAYPVLSAVGDRFIIAKAYTTSSVSPQWGVGADASNGRLRVYCKGTSIINSASVSMNLGQWNHIVVNYNLGNTADFYINGEYKTSASCLGTWDSTNAELVLGATNRSGVNYPNNWNGSIDEIAVWNRHLTASEIKSLYATGTLSGLGTTGVNWNNTGTTNFNQIADGNSTAELSISTTANTFLPIINFFSDSYGFYTPITTTIINETIYTLSSGCTPNLVNTSWGDWANDSCSSNQLQQIRNLTQYDANSCGGANITFYETQLIGNSWLNTTWSDWNNLSCSLTQMNQSRSLTEYDNWGCGINTTYTEYQLVGPSFLNTSWSDWASLGCIGLTGYENKTRNLTQYDSYGCDSNTTFIEYQSVLNESCSSSNPVFTNCRNFNVNQYSSFSQSITATDGDGIDTYWLNDTTYFNVDNSGLITNATLLSSVLKNVLMLSVNDTLGNEANCSFYINIQASGGGSGSSTCRFKKFGFYNSKLPFLKEANCI